MSETAFTKATLSAAAAFGAITSDVWTSVVASQLEPADILQMLAVDKAWKALLKDDDLWLNKLTIIVMQYPALDNLDQGSDESAFQWFWRWRYRGADGRENNRCWWYWWQHGIVWWCRRQGGW